MTQPSRSGRFINRRCRSSPQCWSAAAGSSKAERPLYSDARQVGQWQALFTAEQINGWLANAASCRTPAASLPANIRDPRIAIASDVLTLGFRTSSGGVETVISADAAVSLTDDGSVAIQLIAVRAGALPLPVLQLADELAGACQKLNLPVDAGLDRTASQWCC